MSDNVEEAKVQSIDRNNVSPPKQKYSVRCPRNVRDILTGLDVAYGSPVGQASALSLFVSFQAALQKAATEAQQNNEDLDLTADARQFCKTFSVFGLHRLQNLESARGKQCREQFLSCAETAAYWLIAGMMADRAENTITFEH